jgi:hypothetical protein
MTLAKSLRARPAQVLVKQASVRFREIDDDQPIQHVGKSTEELNFGRYQNTFA